MKFNSADQPYVYDLPDPTVAPYQPVLLARGGTSYGTYLPPQGEIPGLDDMNKLYIDISGEETIDKDENKHQMSLPYS